MPESDPNKRPSRRLRALKPSGYEPESYEEFYGADEQAELFDIMQGVRPEDRFSGKYGILPYLGYYGSGDPEDPAYGVSSINKYDIKNPEDLSQSILSGSAYFDTKRRFPRFERGDPDDPTVGGMLGWYTGSSIFPPNVPSTHDAVKENIRWVEGTGLPDPGESGISAYYPLQDFAPLVAGELSPRDLRQELEAWDREVDLGDGAPENVYKPRFDPLSEDYYPFVSAEDMRTGKVDLEQPVWDRDVGFPSTVVHELTHRGFDTRAVRDFFDEMEDVGSFPEASGKTREWNRLHGGINPRLEHDIMRSRTWPPQRDTVIDPSGNYIDPDAPFLGWTTKTNPIETFQDQFLEWLTPEKQAKYGIDLPDAENLGFLGLQGGGPVYMANGGQLSTDEPPDFDPLNFVIPYLPHIPALSDMWGYLAPEPGTMGSPYSLWMMENIIMEALEGMQTTAAWDADQISAFQNRIYDNVLEAAANDTTNNQLLQDAATGINEFRNITPAMTDDEKWEAWDEYLAAYEPSGDDNADIADAAEKAMEIFGKESDEAKEAFLVAAATYGVTTEQIADATGTTVAAILDNLPEISPIDYAKEAVTAVVEALKKADGSCIVGLDGSVTCDFTWGGQPPFGTGQQTGVPVWTIPGTNTTVGIDTGYNILNAVLGAISPAGAGRPWEDLPQIIYEAVLGQIKGTLSDKVKEEIYNAVLSVADSEGNIDIGVDLKKNCYNADGTINSQVLAGQSCPTGTSETQPACQVVDGVQYVRNADTGVCEAPTTTVTSNPCTDGDGNVMVDAAGQTVYPDANGNCPTTTTITDVVCYSDTDGTTVAALEDGTCPMGSSTTPPAAETDETRCVNSGGTWTDGACVCPTKSTLENGQCMAEAIGPGTTSQQGCEINADGKATGNTWNEDEQKCYGPAGTGPGDPEYTTCENITDYNQSPDANGNYPTVTQNYLTADLPEGGCPTQFGTAPTDDDDDACEVVDGVQYERNTDGVCVAPTVVGGKKICKVYNWDQTRFEDVEVDLEAACPDHYGTPPCKDENGQVLMIGGAMQFPDGDGNCPTSGGGGCPSHQELVNDVCVDKCADGETRNTATGVCEKRGGCPSHQELVNDVCVDKCADDETRNTATGVCEKRGGCPSHQELVNDVCVDKCADDETRNTATGVCEKRGGCPPGQELFNDACVDKCADDETRNTTTGVCEKRGGLTCPTNAYDNDGVCTCTGGYSPTYSADGTLTACTKIEGPECPTNGEINAQGECVCKEGFSPVYTDGVLTACTKVGPPPGGCPPNASMVGGVCQCDDGYTPVYGDDGTLTGCSPVGGNGDVCPANSTRNSAGNCVCDEGYQSSVDSDGLMTCVRFPVENCSNPAWAATHVLECSPCDDDDYAEANPQICGIKDGEPPTRPYATFEGVDMVRPPWVTPEDVRINRYPETEPSTYSILPAPAGSYEYGISSLARRPQDIREAVSVIDPGYEQLRGGPPVFTMEYILPGSEEAKRRQAATDRYYGAMDRLSDYSTQFNVGADELSESLGIPQEQFGWADVEYATPTYGTPPEGYPTSPDLQAAQDRPFYSPWLEEEEEEEESMFAHGGEVDEEPQGLESLLKRRQHAVDTMLVKRGRGNGVR